MEITEVRIKLHNRSTDRVKAYCSITFDEAFVVRDVKIVEGTNGLFVAMPSRKLAVPCPKCRQSNHLRARYCNACGTQLPPPEVPVSPDARTKLHRDVAHPITGSLRQHLQTQVIEAYEAETQRVQKPEYASVSIESDAESDDSRAEPSEYDTLIADLRGGGSKDVGDSTEPAVERTRQGSAAVRPDDSAGEREGVDVGDEV